MPTVRVKAARDEVEIKKMMVGVSERKWHHRKRNYWEEQKYKEAVKRCRSEVAKCKTLE